jgi:CTP synthase
MSKFIFITGGVVSSLGKGVAAASIGCLLESRGFKVTLQKIDPYINVDPGTMNPFQHGEVYVTEDGAETDLDLGHYERFTSATMTRENNVTAGQIYYSVIQKERKGEYLGKTVQVVPHITDEIKEKILKVAKKDVDIVICEIGGTVGDIESQPFLEAIRQFRKDLGKENVLYIHLTLIPYLKSVDELKTKPTQHSVAQLRAIGIQPDIIICRTEKPITKEIKAKIALFCNVEDDAVIQALDVSSVYEVPLMFRNEGLDVIMIKLLNLKYRKQELHHWEKIVEKIKFPTKSVKIAIVGKYTEVQDSYKSIVEALIHGGIANNCEVKISFIDSDSLVSNGCDIISQYDGILVPGGFGSRGIEGKILAAKYARENKYPYFGICLGMQCAVIEFARNVLHLDGANSTEFDENTKYPVISLLPEQKNVENKGGTMRLGAYPCRIIDNELKEMYKEEIVYERHRHRYEFNNEFREMFEENGMKVAGVSPDNKLVEIIKLVDHPFYIGVQFHPEFKSKPTNPHKLFANFISSAIKHKESKL